MKKSFIMLSLVCVLMILNGCGRQVSNIDMENDAGNAVAGLDYRDFERAADSLTSSLLNSGRLQKDDGSRYIVSTGNITNDTTHRISTDQLMVKIRRSLTNSGQVAMTAAVAGDGSADDMVMNVRDLKEGDRADEFNDSTMPAKGQLLAPELNISGKIFQSNVSYSRKTRQEEYYFQLRVTDLTTGLVFWEDEDVIGKRVKD